ncbi:MAG: tetratricopeptide repeat protein [Dehalococcoidia bacterium]
MDLKLVKIIKINFGDKDTTELLDIWNNNDRKSYSDEAFEAIRLILTERGMTVPQPPVYVPIEEKANRQSKDVKRLDAASEINYDPQSEAGQHIEKAYSYNERNKFEDVLRETDAAIKIDPSIAEAYNLRGMALEELGQTPEAMESYRHAIELDQDFHEAKNNLSDLEARTHLEQAYSLKEEHKFEDVLRECDAAIEIDPSRAEAHNLRGVALEELGRPKDALAAYRRAIDLAPSFREAEFNLSDLAAELEGNHKRTAITPPTRPKRRIIIAAVVVGTVFGSIFYILPVFISGVQTLIRRLGKNKKAIN